MLFERNVKKAHQIWANLLNKKTLEVFWGGPLDGEHVVNLSKKRYCCRRILFEIKCRRSFFQEGEDGEEVPKEVMIRTIKLRDH